MEERSSEITGTRTESLKRLRSGLTVFETLSNREKDVLKLIGAGMSNLEIAETFYLSEGIIRNHITSIFSKLGVSDRTQVALLAVRHQFI